MMKYLVFIFSVCFLCSITSCKDECEDIACENGGTCLDGSCDCPEGFSGVNCELTACSDVVCENGGVCENGDCNCLDGYSGTNCEIENRETLLGIWTGTQMCSGIPDANATFTITRGTTGTSIVVNNGLIGYTAEVSEAGSFVLDTYVDNSFPTLVVTTNGTGSINENNELSVTLMTDLNGSPNNECSFVGVQ